VRGKIENVCQTKQYWGQSSTDLKEVALLQEPFLTGTIIATPLRPGSLRLVRLQPQSSVNQSFDASNEVPGFGLRNYGANPRLSGSVFYPLNL
jgi:hypothetical protein